jgi:hypothetical protein
VFGGLRRPGEERAIAPQSPVFRGSDGQLWLDPALVDEDAVLVLETFQCFEHCGAVYELWGQRADGCWWVGRVSTTDVPTRPGLARPLDALRPAFGRLPA